MPDGIRDDDRIFVQHATRWIIIGTATMAVLYGVLWLLAAALTPLAAAFVIAYLFDPLLDRLELLRIPRAASILLLLSGLAAVGVAFAFFAVPRMQGELVELSSELPGYFEGLLVKIRPWLSQWLGPALPTSLQEGFETLRQAGIAPTLQAVRDWLGRVLLAFGGTVGSLIGLLVIPVLAFYLLVDFDHIVARIADQVPRPYLDAVKRRVRVIDALMAGFIRGQLTVCAILGVLYAIGFAVIGIHMALVIGMVAGLLALIPYVGGAVALLSASLMCVFQFGFDAHLFAVVGWYALVQSLEGFVLTPRIVGESLGLHPVTVILALMIGGNLLGFLGLLVAVPVAAVIQVFVGEGLEAYRASSLYTGAGG